MKSFLAALQFLTVLPLPRRFTPDEQALAGAPVYFPLVGFLIGGVIALIDVPLSRLLPPSVAAVLIVILLAACSGALHLDGLADTADGFYSSRPRERILEIMKDSRTGPMGVFALCGVLILKTALIASTAGTWRWWVLVMAPLAGRCALLIQMGLLPYARPEGGLVSLFPSRHPRVLAGLGLIFLLAGGGFIGGWAGFAAGACASAIALLFAAYCRRRLGGLSGDTLGAACELAELGPLLLAAAWFSGGRT
ncbi:MAG: adenosylcobinamide-GDP ribazoletransferase [Syntrophaceae bacterium]|nr:adenosylcobinamide-GDP ribazoletransferase [Syntrophaceae bacterium]